MKDLNVAILHSIPGRVRLRLTRPPRSVDEFIAKVTRHEGIEEIVFNPVTLSLLVNYRPTIVSATEITVRVGIALSLEYDNRIVSIAHKDNNRSLTTLDYYAVSSLLAATISHFIDKRSLFAKYLKYNSGYSTLLAVLRHAVDEVKKEGIYDPEVISVVYLINSLIKGNYLPASAITWFVTFGRHLVLPSTEICLLEAIEVSGEEQQEYVEAIVRPVLHNQLDKNPIKLLIAILGRMMGLNVNRKQGIMEQIQQVATKHGNVLEGLNNKPGPVYLRLTQ